MSVFLVPTVPLFAGKAQLHVDGAEVEPRPLVVLGLVRVVARGEGVERRDEPLCTPLAGLNLWVKWLFFSIIYYLLFFIY
jgi:hypothetical protein